MNNRRTKTLKLARRMIRYNITYDAAKKILFLK